MIQIINPGTVGGVAVVVLVLVAVATVGGDHILMRYLISEICYGLKSLVVSLFDNIENK